VSGSEFTASIAPGLDSQRAVHAHLQWQTVAGLVLKAGRKLSYIRHLVREWNLLVAAQLGFSTFTPGDEVSTEAGGKQIP